MPLRRSPNLACLWRPSVHAWLMFFLIFCGALLANIPLAAMAADAPPQAANIDASLDEARSQIDKIQKQLAAQADKALSDAQLVDLRTSALDIQSRADAAASLLAPQLASVQARVAELGTPAPGGHEAADLAGQRRQLAKHQATLDSQLKLARLISVEAGQVVEQVIKLRRLQFQAQMGERTSSILSGSFWSELQSEWPRDLQRLDPLLDELSALPAALPGRVWAAMLAITVVLLWLCAWARKWLVRIAAKRVAPGRLRRSTYAIAVVLLAVATPMLIVQAWFTGITDNVGDPLSDALAGLLGDLTGAAAFGGLCVGLGYALLEADRPSWRLISISDPVARGLRWVPWGFACPAVISWIMLRLASWTNVSLVSSVALDCLMSLMIGAVIALALRRWGRVRQAGAEQDGAVKGRAMPFWGTVLVAAIWAALIAGFGSLLIGYVALGSFIIRQLIWSMLILATAYLLSVLIDDACSVLLRIIKANDQGAGPARSPVRARSQAVVLLSGLGRLLVYAMALIMLMVPFGEGPAEWARRAQYLYEGIPIGEMHLRPASILLALAVLVLGLVLVRLLKGWLADRYLPTTALDPGMRMSAASLFGYAGYVVIAALTMMAVGIGLERVAWVASALSVGIGFGLQAVVQNFVSGLILLAERPVQVGDWVSLGDVEGDIRRINVRATEIQMGDHSTVIVPNSEFITKIVRNVTHANPIGRVQFVLSMPVSTDVEKARMLMQEVLDEARDVLDEPAPNVMLDGVSANGLAFKLTGYVISPRLVSTVRSTVLFTLLQRLNEAGLPLSTPSTVIVSRQAEATAPASSAVAPVSGGNPA